MKKALLFSLLMVFSVSTCPRGGLSPVSAAEVRPLTLAQALDVADSGNHNIRKAQEFFRQVEGKYVEERAAALPHLSLNASLIRQQDDSQAVIGAGFFPTRQDVYTGGLELSQALFTWGKLGAAVRAAEKGYKTAEERLRTARQDTRRDVTTAFYDTLLARELHAISLQNLAQKERHHDEAGRRFAIGIATDYDVLAARVAVDNARPDTIRAANLIRTAKDRLRFLLAVDHDVEPEGNLAPVSHPVLTHEEALQVARKRRPELEELRRTKEVYDELVRIERAADKPRLDFRGGYGWRQLDIGAQSGSGAAWNAGLYLSFPFFDGLKTRGRLAQTKSERHTLELEEARMGEVISLQLRDALNAVREAGEIVASLSGTVQQAERLLTMAEKGFELGVKIRLEVEDAEVNLLQARGNLARARRDLLVARVNLDRAMGVLGEPAKE